MFNHLSTSLFEETDDQVEKRKEAECYNRTRASWGLRHRDHWTSGSTRIGQFQISPEHQIQFQEEPGQQQRVWDCSLILSKFLYSYFPPVSRLLWVSHVIYLDLLRIFFNTNE